MRVSSMSDARSDVVVLNRKRDEREAMKRWGERVGRPVRRVARGNQPHFVQAQRAPRRVGGVEMPEMNRVERAAENAEPA